MSLRVGPPETFGVRDEDICKFYEIEWPRRTVLSQPSFYKWQFRDAPAAIGHASNCVIGFDDSIGKIAGVLGVTARPFFLRGKQRNGAELTTWMVADGYRSSRIVASMIKSVQERYDVAAAMGLTDLSLPLALRSGCRYLRAIPRFIRPYNFDAIATVGAVAPLARKLGRQWTRAPARLAYTVQEGMGGADSVWTRFREQFNCFARDEDHLQWRYSRHPSFVYRAFTVATGQAAVCVAIRLETVVPTVKILHVTDLFGDDLAIPAALSFIDDFARQNEIDVADFFCTSARVGRHFINLSWFSAVDDLSLRFPHLFHPVTMRDPPTSSLIYWSQKDFNHLCDYSNLYITKSDIDLDRPVPHT